MILIKTPTFIKIFIFVFFSGVLALSALLAIKLRNHSLEAKKLKLDYFTVNQIKYGLLSGDKWSTQVNSVLSSRIDSFDFSSENKSVLQQQVNGILNRLLNELDHVLHQPQEKIGNRLKFKVINSFISVDKFRPEIPRFTSAILSQIEKKENKEAIKKLLKDQVTSVLEATNQDTTGEQKTVLLRYNSKSVTSFNNQAEKRSRQLEERQYRLSYYLISLLLLTLLLWLYILRNIGNYWLCFLLSVAISLAVLLIEISLPMIDIDARIAKLDLKLLGSHIIFTDQVIFFQTKSILDVIQILLSHGKADSTFVGALILLFSVLFPITKLICATIFLFRPARSGKFVHYMAFKSGKWSMAGVMVIAIFMAYVGFRGILDDQLADITVHNETINMISTNGTHLQPGFILFVAFVIYNLVLAEILRKINSRLVIKKASIGEAF